MAFRSASITDCAPWKGYVDRRATFIFHRKHNIIITLFYLLPTLLLLLSLFFFSLVGTVGDVQKRADTVVQITATRRNGLRVQRPVVQGRRRLGQRAAQRERTDQRRPLDGRRVLVIFFFLIFTEDSIVLIRVGPECRHCILLF